jgi:hypothetical protein
MLNKFISLIFLIFIFIILFLPKNWIKNYIHKIFQNNQNTFESFFKFFKTDKNKFFIENKFRNEKKNLNLYEPLYQYIENVEKNKKQLIKCINPKWIGLTNKNYESFNSIIFLYHTNIDKKKFLKYFSLKRYW